ncbi:MAG: hypothetical protein U1E66_06235 [Rhodospirillales bacterium]
MYGEFLLLERDDEPARRAERLAFGETSGRNEAWLRDILFKHPELLPIREIDPTYGPLIPLCTELRTEAGSLDLAFINPHGRLTLVECKLWRNPEARRKVVAQVLDYARSITKWSYSDLQRQVSAATGRKGNVPFDIASAHESMLMEHRFIDDVGAAIRGGRFLLLIVGDGIREDVGAIAQLINRNAASGFSFGLVEVGLYGLDDGGLIIQPRTVAKTHIIERTVVFVRDAQGENVIVVDELLPDSTLHDEPNSIGESPKQAAYRAWWTPVMEMEFDDPDQESPKLYYPSNVRSPLPAPRTWITAYKTGGDHAEIGVFTSGRKNEYVALMRHLAPLCDNILSRLPDGSELRTVLHTYVNSFITYRFVKDFADDNAQRRWLIETLNHYANVLRPIIKTVINSPDNL